MCTKKMLLLIGRVGILSYLKPTVLKIPFLIKLKFSFLSIFRLDGSFIRKNNLAVFSLKEKFEKKTSIIRFFPGNKIQNSITSRIFWILFPDWIASSRDLRHSTGLKLGVVLFSFFISAKDKRTKRESRLGILPKFRSEAANFERKCV